MKNWKQNINIVFENWYYIFIFREKIVYFTFVIFWGEVSGVSNFFIKIFLYKHFLNIQSTTCILHRLFLKYTQTYWQDRLYQHENKFIFYTSTKSWRGYIFTAVCLCVCVSVCVSGFLVNKIPAERMNRFRRSFR